MDITTVKVSGYHIRSIVFFCKKYFCWLCSESGVCSLHVAWWRGQRTRRLVLLIILEQGRVNVSHWPGYCPRLLTPSSPLSRTLTPGQELSATLRPKDPKIDSEQILRIKDWRMIYWSIWLSGWYLSRVTFFIFNNIQVSYLERQRQVYFKVLFISIVF